MNVISSTRSDRRSLGEGKGGDLKANEMDLISREFVVSQETHDSSNERCSAM